MNSKIGINPLLLSLVCFFVYTCGQKDQSQRHVDTLPVTPQKYYSADDPGDWYDMAEDHVPKIELSQSKKENNVLVYVILKKPDANHYIEELGILDAEFNVINSVKFPMQKRSSFQGSFTFFQTKGLSKYRAYARCNQHDLWVTPLSDAREVP